jgi:hypothetical protein
MAESAPDPPPAAKLARKHHRTKPAEGSDQPNAPGDGGRIRAFSKRTLAQIQGLTEANGEICALVTFTDSAAPEVVSLAIMHKFYLNDLLLFYEAHVRLTPAAAIGT